MISSKFGVNYATNEFDKRKAEGYLFVLLIKRRRKEGSIIMTKVSCVQRKGTSSFEIIRNKS